MSELWIPIELLIRSLRSDQGNSILFEVYHEKVCATEVVKSKSPTADFLARKT